MVATKLFGSAFPQWFGTLGESVFSLFQDMTLESWALGIVRPAMEVFPNAWVFFLIFILASIFTLLNLFIAVIVNAIQQERHSDGRPSIESELTRLHDEISRLREEVARHAGRRPETGQH